MKCRSSQELIFAQIPWATAQAERSRAARDSEHEARSRTETNYKRPKGASRYYPQRNFSDQFYPPSFQPTPTRRSRRNSSPGFSAPMPNSLKPSRSTTISFE